MNHSRVWVSVSVLLGLGWAWSSNDANAFPAYRTQAVAQFKLDDKTTDCAYCHVSSSGGAPWNPFGQLVQIKLEGDIGKALYEALAAKLDSDEDGYADALEVYAKTLPGDKDSKPKDDVKTLEAAFEKAGGLEPFKPNP
jgi:hypothetical protein